MNSVEIVMHCNLDRLSLCGGIPIESACVQCLWRKICFQCEHKLHLSAKMRCPGSCRPGGWWGCRWRGWCQSEVQGQCLPPVTYQGWNQTPGVLSSLFPLGVCSPLSQHWHSCSRREPYWSMRACTDPGLVTGRKLQRFDHQLRFQAASETLAVQGPVTAAHILLRYRFGSGSSLSLAVNRSPQPLPPLP